VPSSTPGAWYSRVLASSAVSKASFDFAALEAARSTQLLIVDLGIHEQLYLKVCSKWRVASVVGSA
jgi:hypothetical protein